MRNHIIVGGAILVAIIIGVLAFFYSSGRTPNAPVAMIEESPVAVSFTEIATGTRSTVTTRTNYLITSADQLHKLWSMVDAKGNPPAVDFASYAVAAVFAGAEPTSDYTISVSKVEDTNERTVIVTLAKPPNGCTLKYSTTTPYQIISLPVTSLPLAHEDVATTTNCSQR